MKRTEYYTRLLEAIDAAADWGGSLPPEEMQPYWDRMKELKTEVKRRRRNAARQGRKKT